MKKIPLVLISILLIGCNSSKKQSSKLFSFIPEGTDVVLAIHDLETVKNDFRNNDLVSELVTLSAYADIEKHLYNLQTNDSVLVCLEKQQDHLNYAFITKLKDSLFGSISLDSLKMPYKVMDSFFISSNSVDNLAKIIPSDNVDFESLLKTSDGDKSFSIILNNASSGAFGGSLLETNDIEFSDRTLIETSINSEQILINGITYTTDSLSRAFNVFKYNTPQENTIQNIAPNNADGYLSFSYSDFDNLNEALIRYRAESIDSLFNPELFQTISEVGQIYYDDQMVLAAQSIDATATVEALRDHLEIESTYRTVDILQFNDPELFQNVFGPFITINDLSKYVRLDDFFVFSNSEESLHNVIINYQNGTTIGGSSAYQACQSHLSDASSFSVVAKAGRLKNIMSQWFKDDLDNIPTEAYNLSAFQWVQDNGFAHINGVIKKHKARAVVNAINEEFNVTLDADIITPPQFVTNHRTKQKDIVVQDVNNTLYLISNTGKILWQKKIIGNVLGRVEQVDLYRNGRLQLAFATPYRIYVIDRNGRNVGAFPMKFGQRISQPLSVFDYDNNRSYRFLVTQGNDLLMYDNNARFVNGFRYKNPNIIKNQPKHFRIGRKDYIVFSAGNRMKILDRRGQVRVNVSETFDFSGNEIYLYNNNFITTTTQGELIQVDQQGKVTRSDLKMTDDHVIDATAKTLVTLDENKLGIKQKTIELDFGEYTDPKIHYINDKIYVTVTDLQSQKIYVFDSQAEPISNFPVYGNSTIDLENADSDRNLEFVTKGEPNSVVMYKKN